MMPSYSMLLPRDLQHSTPQLYIKQLLSSSFLSSLRARLCLVYPCTVPDPMLEARASHKHMVLNSRLEQYDHEFDKKHC